MRWPMRGAIFLAALSLVINVSPSQAQTRRPIQDLKNRMLLDGGAEELSAMTYESCMSKQHPGMSWREQLKACEYIRDENEWARKNRPAVSAPEADFPTVYAPTVPVLVDYRPVRERFLHERPGLLASLRSSAASLAQATDRSSFETAATSAETLMRNFISEYANIRNLPDVEPFVTRLERTADLLKRARNVWRSELNETARIDYLIAQKAEPAETRDPFAHPAVVDGNIKAARETQSRLAHDRQEVVPLAKETLASLTRE
jgi:hypothetical protein